MRPTARPSSTAWMPMSTEGPRRLKMTSATGRPVYRKDVPRSPRMRLPRYLMYCTGTGSFRPYFSSMISCCSGASMEKRSVSNGVPGSFFIRKKVTVMIIRSVSTRYTRRLPMYFNILLPPFLSGV